MEPASAWNYNIASDHKPLTTTGGHVWPAARRLAEFFEIDSHVLGLNRTGVTVLELGAGVGWLGISMARNLPNLACMLLTEQEQGDGLTWLAHNVEINCSTPNVARSVLVAPCDWGVFLNGRSQEEASSPAEALSDPLDPIISSEPSLDFLLPASSVGRLDPRNGKPWDFIIGSDLIYTEEGCRALPKVMQALATKGHTQIYYCHTKHRFDHFDMALFEELESCGFTCEEVIEAGKQLPPPSPPPLTTLYPDMRVAVFKITLKT